MEKEGECFFFLPVITVLEADYSGSMYEINQELDSSAV